MTESEVDSLFQKGVFPDQDQPEELIQTHISWVIMCKRFVYKIKKPLKLPFLDFSDLEKRKYYCLEELRLNRRLAPEIYLNVLEVAVRGEVFEVSPDTPNPVEYVVQMKKLAPELQMNRLLRLNKVNKLHICLLAEKLTGFHEKADVVKAPFSANLMIEQFSNLLQIKDTLMEVTGTKIGLEEIVAHAESFILENKSLFENRVESGFIRDCHGDLHSGNIFLYDHPIIFDCLEFDEGLRQIDILNELAFLCMDLEFFNRMDLSSHFLGCYFKKEMPVNIYDLRLFNFYKCYRANIRAKVTALSLAEGADDTSEKIKDCRRYLELMNEYNCLF